MVVLIGVGLAAAVIGAVAALLPRWRRSRAARDEESMVSSAERIAATMAASRAIVVSPEPTMAPTISLDDPVEDARQAREDEHDDAVVLRFRMPGERSPTPRLFEDEPLFGDNTVFVEDTVFGDDIVSDLSDSAANAEDEPAASETVIDLSDGATASENERNGDEPARFASSARQPDLDADDGVDRVVLALIERVRTSSRDVVEVVSEMVEHDLDTDQMEIVLTHLVEREGRHLPKGNELTLSGAQVPHRPGRLSAFAELPEHEKRRVIIRVLCLLLAREERTGRPAKSDQVSMADELSPRDPWPDDAAEAEEAHLPARRRRLARLRR